MTVLRRAVVGPLAAVALAACPEEPLPPAPVDLPAVKPLTPVAIPPLARLTAVEGPVRLERDGGQADASPGPLYEGDVVDTGSSGRAVVIDEQGRTLELEADTRFRVGSREAGLELVFGALSFAPPPAGVAGQGLKLRTGSGTATLVEGAGGRVQVVDGGLLGEVTFGAIEFEFPDAGVRTVKPGTFSVVLGRVEFDLPPQPPPAGTVRVVVTAGRPVVKRPGARAFSPVKTGDALEAGTAWQVPPNAQAQLEAGSARVQLGGGATGIVEGLRDEGGVPVLSLSKAVGPLSVQFDGRSRAAVKLGPFELSGAREATVTVAPAGKRSRLEVKAGEVTVLVNGEPMTVRAGDGVQVDGGKASRFDLKPALVVPAAPRVRVHADAVPHVALVFPDEKNRVEVARDESFSSVLIAGEVGRQVLVPGLSRAPLFFRTTGEDGQVQRQGRVDFLPDVASARDTATRSDVVAETGQKATVYYQSKVPALTFVFNPFEGARSYEFTLLTSDLAHELVNRRVSEGRLVLEPGVLSEGEFLWLAKPLDVNGSALKNPKYNKLEVLYDNARTSLLVERPLPGERAGPDVKAVGVAPSRSQLFINGRPVKLDERGRFSVPVPNTDTVLFRVVAGDTESYWLRRLRR